MTGNKETGKHNILASTRVLDLTNEKGFLCGKILGDLGADVIKIEKPGGDVARNIGPFYHDIPDPEKSLYWWAFNTSKRGITLNIETRDGQEIFKRLAKNKNVIIVESFPPGYMAGLGLGYDELSKTNPGLIMTSITPFGQSGPYKDYKASDITIDAMSGFMYICGDADRAPLRISVEQTYPHAGMHAALATVFAHYYHQLTGEGQHIDVSVRDCLILGFIPSVAYSAGVNVQRPGPYVVRHLKKRNVFQCKDGYVSTHIQLGRLVDKTIHLVDWMHEEGKDKGLKELDWTKYTDTTTSQEQIDQWDEIIGEFFMTHTKDEIAQGSLGRDIMLFPANNTKGLLENKQLLERDFWEHVEHPELNTTIIYPGKPFKSTQDRWRISRRPPLIGEHNKEIFIDELGFTNDELGKLRRGGVI